MAKKLSRRDFIKTSSAAAAGASILSSAGPVMSALEPKGTKSRVVIAKDTTCKGNQTKITAMVDNAIMQLTGVTETAKAYEALFPTLSNTTKIIIKYNSAIVTAPASCMPLVALQNGLKSMLSGAFPAANILLRKGAPDDMNGAGSESISIGGTNYSVKTDLVSADYYINFAPCYSYSSPPLRSGFKNAMTMLVATYSNFHNMTSLATMISLGSIKTKLALFLMDAVSVNTGSAKDAFTVIASKDLVAGEYQGLEILKANGLTSATNATTLVTNAAATGAGTNDPTKMEIINWTPTNIMISSGDVKALNDQIKVKSLKNRTIIQYPAELGSNGSLTVYDVHGRGMWTMQGFRSGEAWNHCDATGAAVPAGIYLYLLKAKGVIVKGMFDIRR